MNISFEFSVQESSKELTSSLLFLSNLLPSNDSLPSNSPESAKELTSSLFFLSFTFQRFVLYEYFLRILGFRTWIVERTNILLSFSFEFFTFQRFVLHEYFLRILDSRIRIIERTNILPSVSFESFIVPSTDSPIFATTRKKNSFSTNISFEFSAPESSKERWTKGKGGPSLIEVSQNLSRFAGALL